jgi:hypothetical protein
LRYVFICLLAAGAAAALWLFATRSFSLLADRVYTVPLGSPVPDHFRYDNGVIELGSLRLYTLTAGSERSTVTVSISATGRVSLLDSGRSFPFGPGRALPSPSGLPDFEFMPDPGDTVRVTLDRSVLSWPTFFELNLMTGSVSSWKRNLYCRLEWTKRSGARLEMLWRQEQGYFRDGGWLPAAIEVVTAGLMQTSVMGATD